EARLTEVVEAGSPAHHSDRELLDRLRSRELRLDGLSMTVLEAGTTSRSPATGPVDASLGEPEAGPAGSVTVRVRSATSAHRQVAADGTVVREVPGRDGTADL